MSWHDCCRTRSQILHSRSARDLLALAVQQPGLVRELAATRPALLAVGSGPRDPLDPSTIVS